MDNPIAGMNDDVAKGLPPHTAFQRSDGEASDAPSAYSPPTLEPLGQWQALTLQMSIPVGPGGGF